MGTYEVLAIIAAMTIAVLVFLILWLTPTVQKKAIKDLKKSIESRDYSKLIHKLRRSGMDKCTPTTYIIFRYGCALWGILLAVLINGKVMGICVMAVAGYFLPEVYLCAKKSAENKKMAADIRHLYNIMHLQQCAGSYIVDTITDSYRVVHHWRLKKALLDLAGAINGKKPIKEATAEFAEKFDNPHIATMADIIQHAIETGDTTAMLKDISEQISNIQEVEYIIKESKQKMESILFLTLLFIGLLGCMFYLMSFSFAAISKGLFI